GECVHWDWRTVSTRQTAERCPCRFVGRPSLRSIVRPLRQRDLPPVEFAAISAPRFPVANGSVPCHDVSRWANVKVGNTLASYIPSTFPPSIALNYFRKYHASNDLHQSRQVRSAHAHDASLARQLHGPGRDAAPRWGGRP